MGWCKSIDTFNFRPFHISKNTRPHAGILYIHNKHIIYIYAYISGLNLYSELNVLWEILVWTYVCAIKTRYGKIHTKLSWNSWEKKMLFFKLILSFSSKSVWYRNFIGAAKRAREKKHTHKIPEFIYVITVRAQALVSHSFSARPFFFCYCCLACLCCVCNRVIQCERTKIVRIVLFLSVEFVIRFISKSIRYKFLFEYVIWYDVVLVRSTHKTTHTSCINSPGAHGKLEFAIILYAWKPKKKMYTSMCVINFHFVYIFVVVNVQYGFSSLLLSSETCPLRLSRAQLCDTRCRPQLMEIVWVDRSMRIGSTSEHFIIMWHYKMTSFCFVHEHRMKICGAQSM